MLAKLTKSIFLSKIAKGLLLPLAFLCTNCSTSWKRPAWERPPWSPAEKELIEDHLINTPASVKYTYSTIDKEEICFYPHTSSFPLDVVIVPGDSNSKYAKQDLEFQSLENNLKEIYDALTDVPLENLASNSDNLRVYVLPDVSDRESFIDHLKSSRLPIPKEYRSIAKTFYSYGNTLPIYYGQGRVEHITYKNGQYKLKFPISITTYPRKRFYTVVDHTVKVPLKSHTLSGNLLRKASFTPLTKIRKDYSMKLPIKLQKELKLPLQGKKLLPFGYTQNSNISSKTTYSPEKLLFQSDTLWSHYFKKFTRISKVPNNEENMKKYRVELDLSYFCKFAIPKYELKRQISFNYSPRTGVNFK